MAKYLLGTVFCIAVIVFGIAVYQVQSSIAPVAVSDQQSSQEVTQTTTSTSSATTTTTITSALNSYTLAQVAQHGSASSCWTAINGNVYDLTNWIDQHPGGPEAILSICGTDGSAAFNAQHGGQAQPEQELANFYIGTLAS